MERDREMIFRAAELRIIEKALDTPIARLQEGDRVGLILSDTVDVSEHEAKMIQDFFNEKFPKQEWYIIVGVTQAVISDRKLEGTSRE